MLRKCQSCGQEFEIDYSLKKIHSAFGKTIHALLDKKTDPLTIEEIRETRRLLSRSEKILRNKGCPNCRKIYHRKYMEKNKDKYNIYRKKYRDEKNKNKIYYQKIENCLACGDKFKTNVYNKKTCSSFCSEVYRRNMSLERGRKKRLILHNIIINSISIQKCQNCGRDFKPSIKNMSRQKYCSYNCRYRFYYKERPTLNLFCQNCGKEFKTTRSRQKYCSGKCLYIMMNKNKKPVLYKRKEYVGLMKNCQFCSSEFKIKRIDHNFCSKKCYKANWRKINTKIGLKNLRENEKIIGRMS